MSEDSTETPWQTLERMVAAGARQSVEAFVDGLTSKETARAFSRLDSETQAQLLSLLEPAEAAEVIEEIAETQAVEAIAELPAPEAAAIVDELRSDEQADLLGELPVADSDAILEQMPEPEAASIRHLMEYPADTAGGLMVTEFLSYGKSRTVGDVVDDMRRRSDVYSDYDVQYSYVTGAGEALVGVLPMRDGGEVLPFRNEGFGAHQQFSGLSQRFLDVFAQRFVQQFLFERIDDLAQLALVEPQAFAPVAVLYLHAGVVVVQNVHGYCAARTLGLAVEDPEGIRLPPDGKVHPVEIRVGLVLHHPQLVLVEPDPLASPAFVNRDCCQGARGQFLVTFGALHGGLLWLQVNPDSSYARRQTGQSLEQSCRNTAVSRMAAVNGDPYRYGVEHGPFPLV